MRKLVLLGCITLITLLQATMIDGIALVVEGEPVTIAEMRAVQKQMNVSKEQATDLLIQDRLQKSAMKDIDILEADIDAKTESIATQNNLTVPQMQKILKEQGTTWNKYRSSVKDAMKKEKFYQENIAKFIPSPSEDELKIFYTNHKNEFIIPSSISMIEYSALSEEAMKKFLQSKNTKGIQSSPVTKSTKDLNPALLGSILQTQDGSFTRPLNAGDRFISYKVLSKKGQATMPFEAAKGAVAAKWKQQQQGKALKDYFEKLKTNADIQVIR
ncbi:peptidylprolyl isomerase [Sulfurovum sp.]|uniref:peptidylprolyl isomerase n=1 Tax=Sulfurovum sp. TaxID=1969726 RepID=UPI002867DCB4|nr:peptidylprolyl isomerase [Sulfurovum sp.]